MKIKSTIIALLIVAVCVSTGFMIHKSDTTEIIGKWYRNDGIYIEFFDSGVWECAEGFEGYGGTWKLSGNKIYLTDLLGNDYTLILQSDNNLLILNGEIYNKLLENNYKFANYVD